MQAKKSGLCTIEGCDKPIEAKGYCPMHYQRQRIHGSVHHTRHQETRSEMESRFWQKVQESSGCWLWQGRIGKAGYGVFYYQNREHRAHRLAYELNVAAIPDGMVIDHACHTLACVKPDHLRLATVKQNAENRKGANRGGKSGIRGVSLHRGRWWLGRVTHNYYVTHTKYCATQEEAAEYVLAKRQELFTHAIERTSS